MIYRLHKNCYKFGGLDYRHFFFKTSNTLTLLRIHSTLDYVSPDMFNSGQVA
jgi:hypothetical protein